MSPNGRHIDVFTDLKVIYQYHVYWIYLNDFLDIYHLVYGINSVVKNISRDLFGFTVVV